MKDFYQKGRASVIIDGQYGSTGKGLLAGYLARHSTMPKGHVTHTTNAAPNAGHTTEWMQEVSDDSFEHKKLVTYHLPTGGVLRDELCYVNAGAIVNLEMLHREMEEAERVTGHRPMLQIHPQAALLLPSDIEEEMDAAGTNSISSTRKGVGAALTRKIRREADTMVDHHKYISAMNLSLKSATEHMPDKYRPFTVNRQDFNRSLRFGHCVSIEVPQGISLGLNHSGFYPYCTSREVSVAQALSDADIHPHFLGMVAMSMRTFPIRVGSLPGSTSGPYFFDQKEIEWQSLDLQPELTTVTKRPRRLFTWSREQYRRSLSKARPQIVFLNFVNYFQSSRDFQGHLVAMHEDHELVGVKPALFYGLGPRIEDVYDDEQVASTRLMSIIEGRKVNG